MKSFNWNNYLKHFLFHTLKKCVIKHNIQLIKNTFSNENRKPSMEYTFPASYKTVFYGWQIIAGQHFHYCVLVSRSGSSCLDKHVYSISHLSIFSWSGSHQCSRQRNALLSGRSLIHLFEAVETAFTGLCYRWEPAVWIINGFMRLRTILWELYELLIGLCCDFTLERVERSFS